MDKEFLSDYKAKEDESISNFRRRVLEGSFCSSEGFPSTERFRKVRKPLSFAAPYQSIWPQLPLTGSLLVRLHSWITLPEDFHNYYGFEVGDIRRLVEFSRDTGKVQFALVDDPMQYLGLDFLEPIFKELKPPALITYPYDFYADEKTQREAIIEFNTLAKIEFFPKLVDLMQNELSGFTIEHVKKRITDYQRDYMMLKALGYSEIIDALNNALVSDAWAAMRLFMVYGNLLTEPMMTPIEGVYNFSTEELQDYGSIPSELQPDPEQVLPCEVGSFLLKKLSLVPESYLSCLDVIETYAQEDLEKAFSSLVEAVKAKNIDLTTAKSGELSEIFENVWQDSDRISKTKNIADYAIPVNLAALGGVAGAILQNAPISAGAGVLLGLGYKVAEKIIAKKTDSLSERIAKINEPNYVSMIYDFKKKHKLK